MKRSLNDLLIRVCNHTKTNIKDVVGNSRKREIVDARHAFALCAFKEEYTYEEIGEVLDKHHSSIQNLVKDRPMTPGITYCVRSIIESSTEEDEIVKLALKLSTEPSDKQVRSKLKELL